MPARHEQDCCGSCATTPAAAPAPTTSRRAFVRAVASAGGAVATAAVLAACSSGGTGGSDSEGGSAAAGSVEKFEFPASKVPVGGGVVLADKNVVVTQPKAGTYAAFSAICTHQGCPLSSVEERGAFCACHSSYFDIADGSVVAGPARAPLPAVPIVEDGGTLVVGGP